MMANKSKKNSKQSKSTIAWIIIAIVVIALAVLFFPRSEEIQDEAPVVDTPVKEKVVAEPVTEPATVAGNIEVRSQTYNTKNGDSLSWTKNNGVAMIKQLDCKLNEDGTAKISFTLDNPTDNSYVIGLQDPEDGKEGIQLSVVGERIKMNEAENACGTSTLNAKGQLRCTIDNSKVKRSALDGSQKASNINIQAERWNSRVDYTCPE